MLHLMQSALSYNKGSDLHPQFQALLCFSIHRFAPTADDWLKYLIFNNHEKYLAFADQIGVMVQSIWF